MKKPIIKNWIKYWSTAIAVTGMMAMGACDNNDSRTAENERDFNTEETVATSRENLSDNAEEAEMEMEQTADNLDSETESQESFNQTQFENTSNTSARSGMSASAISDMDSYLEEHQEVDQAITETLVEIDAEGIDQQSTQFDRQSDQDFSQDRENNQDAIMEEDGENFNNQNLDNSATPGSMDGTQNQDELDRNDFDNENEPTGMDEQNQSAEPSVGYTTDGQGNTQMNINSNQDDRQGNDRGTADEGLRSNPANTGNNETDSDLYSPDQDEDGQSAIDRQNQSLDQQGNTYDNQRNTELGQNNQPDEQGRMYEQYINTYSSDLNEDDRQRMEDISMQYNERRESMRGQINDETGAYISPEVEARPSVGFDEIMSVIQENIEYPQDAVAAQMEGTVFVNFVVDENGNVTNAQAFDDIFAPAAKLHHSDLNPNKFSEQEIENLREDLRKEAVKAVEKTSGMWEAGSQDGQTVKSELQLPVRFEVAGTSGTGSITPER